MAPPCASSSHGNTFDARVTALVTNVGDTHTRIADTVQTQLDGLSERFGSGIAQVTDDWTAALTRHEAGNAQLHQQLQTAFQTYTDTFDTSSAALLASVGATHTALQAELATALAAARSDTRTLHERLAGSVETQLDGLAARSGSAVGSVAESWTAALSAHELSTDTLTRETRDALAAFAARFEAEPLTAFSA